MQNIYIYPTFTTLLSIMLVYLSMAVYLLLWKPRSKASIWMAMLNLGMVISSLGWAIGTVVPYSLMAEGLQPLSSRLGILGFSVQVMSLMQFAYYYKGNTSPRESVYVLWGSLGLIAFFMLASFLSLPRMLLNFLSLSYFLGGLAWAIIILMRKTVRLSRNGATRSGGFLSHLIRPQNPKASSCRAFGGLSFLFMVLFIYQLLVWIVPNTLGLSYALAPLLSMVSIFWMFIAFTNDRTQRASILVKLVGTVQLVVMSMMVIISIVLFGSSWVNEVANFEPLENMTLRFEPAGTAYHQQRVPLAWRDVDGDEVLMEDESDHVIRFDFTFPFYGKSWHDGYLNSNGLLTFGERIGTPGRLPVYEPPRFYGKAPKIGLLFSDLDPSRGQVTTTSSEDALTITWLDVPRFQAEEGAGADMQMTMFADGVIELTYKTAHPEDMKSPAQSGALLGIHPGVGSGDGVSISFDPEEGVTGAAMEAIFEDRYLLKAQAVHPMGSKLSLMAVITFFSILLIYPWLLRGSLLKPLRRLLDGVNRVQQGDMDVKVPLSSGDEIGELTDHFNGMTTSVKEAREKLTEYAGTLESRVEVRTRELRESLENLQRAQQQLIQSEKMASLGQLTAGIAHEIKNPLNFVNNFAELSLELVSEIKEEAGKVEAELPRSFWEEIFPLLGDLELHQEKINKHGQRADGIVQSMLSHARNAPGERSVVAFNQFVDEYVNLAFHGLRTADSSFNVTIERNYAPCVGDVALLPQEMGQVLVNLLNNALYAIRERADAGEAGYKPIVQVNTSCEDASILLSIVDNGPGIADDKLERVFEPFYTTKPTGSGTGLGLSLSYDIVVKSHGGKLYVESTEGEGAAFTIALPVALPEQVAAT